MSKLNLALLLVIAVCSGQSTASPTEETKPPDRSTLMQVWGETVKRARAIETIRPACPADPKIRLSGHVILEVWIRADGTVANAKVLTPMPLGMSDAAVEAVLKWRYSPGTVGGVAVPVVQNESVNCALRAAGRQ